MQHLQFLDTHSPKIHLFHLLFVFLRRRLIQCFHCRMFRHHHNRIDHMQHRRRLLL